MVIVKKTDHEDVNIATKLSKSSNVNLLALSHFRI